MRKLLFILTLTILTSCGVNWHVSTYNYDPIYEDENYIVVSDDVKVDTLNEFQFRNRLRTDFNFRYDFAQYALSQPRSFDWNNRLLGRQYDSRWNSYYWNRTQMWNDWVWGYTGWNSWGSPHRWSPFGYDRWGYGIYYGWNNHGWGYNNWMGNVHYGWNNYYGWNGYYNNNWGWRNQMNNYAWQNRHRSNTVRVNGRRGSISNEVVNNRRVRTNTRANTNTRTNTKPRVYLNQNTPVNNNTKPRVIREKPRVPVIRNNNTRPIIRNNNSRPPVINRSTPVRNNSTPNRRSGGTPRR
jgi:hypothetical protein